MITPINRHHDPVDLVQELGFTDLEARLYFRALTAGPETAYASAKAISKPVANCYKAIASLQTKGAVEVDDGDPRLVRATPPAELIARLRAAFAQRAASAEHALATLNTNDTDERVYELKSAAQVIERAKRLLRDATKCAVIDVFPQIADALAPDLKAAAERGVSVVALLYGELDVPGVNAINHSEGHLVTELIRGEHLLLCTDARAALLALLEPATQSKEPPPHWPDQGGVRQAIFTQSPFVAWHLHDNFHHQLLTYAIRDSLRDDTELLDKIKGVYKKRLPGIAPITTPGWTELLKRHGGEHATERTRQLIESGRLPSDAANAQTERHA